MASQGERVAAYLAGGLLVAADGQVLAICACCSASSRPVCNCGCHALPRWPADKELKP